ncbi:MAG: hypothetical protein IJ523_00275 [Succinivibrionaceae bacterium]|nr:hypothetical protein [Succinivibrionaceae bacterium]
MSIKLLAAGAALLPVCAAALPDGWIAAGGLGGDVSFYVNSSKTISIAPVETGDLTIEQMGEEMRELYGDLGFSCANYRLSSSLVSFDCTRSDDRNAEMPRKVSIYLLKKDNRITAASLIGGASYEDLKLIMGSNSL